MAQAQACAYVVLYLVAYQHCSLHCGKEQPEVLIIAARSNPVGGAVRLQRRGLFVDGP
jgi:hypothetical protein